jgi:hypothetical protein
MERQTYSRIIHKATPIDSSVLDRDPDWIGNPDLNLSRPKGSSKKDRMKKFYVSLNVLFIGSRRNIRRFRSKYFSVWS